MIWRYSTINFRLLQYLFALPFPLLCFRLSVTIRMILKWHSILFNQTDSFLTALSVQPQMTENAIFFTEFLFINLGKYFRRPWQQTRDTWATRARARWTRFRTHFLPAIIFFIPFSLPTFLFLFYYFTSYKKFVTRRQYQWWSAFPLSYGYPPIKMGIQMLQAVNLCFHFVLPVLTVKYPVARRSIIFYLVHYNDFLE